MKTHGLLVGLTVLGLSTTAMAADNLKEMFSLGTVKGEFSLLSFTRDFKGDTPENRDTALGGTLYYKTDSLYGISLGTAFGTTQPFVDNDDYGTYYGISAPVHEDVTRLQEYYIQGDYFDTTIKVGAQELDTPFLLTHKIRMIPRSYRGVSLVNKSIENLSLQAYYLNAHQGWVDSDFVDFTDDVYIGGATYKLPIDFLSTKVEAWYFSMLDCVNQTYFKANFSKKFDNDMLLHFAPTFFTQNSQGDELEGERDTYQAGVNAGIGAFGFDLTGFYAKTGDDAVWDNWGYGKVIIQQIATSGERGDEDAYAAILSYDFGTIGVKGLKAYVFYAMYDAPESTINETDFSIQYDFSGPLEGLGVRARYAMVDKDSGEEDLDDIRFYLTYRFSLSGKE